MWFVNALRVLEVEASKDGDIGQGVGRIERAAVPNSEHKCHDPTADADFGADVEEEEACGQERDAVLQRESCVGVWIGEGVEAGVPGLLGGGLGCDGCGWVRGVRKASAVRFVDITDGSSMRPLQAVVDKSKATEYAATFRTPSFVVITDILQSPSWCRSSACRNMGHSAFLGRQHPRRRFASPFC